MPDLGVGVRDRAASSWQSSNSGRIRLCSTTAGSAVDGFPQHERTPSGIVPDQPYQATELLQALQNKRRGLREHIRHRA